MCIDVYRVEEHVSVLSQTQFILSEFHVYTKAVPALHHLLLLLLQPHSQLRRAHVQNVISSIQQILQLEKTIAVGDQIFKAEKNIY